MANATKFETLNGFPRETITLANWRTRPYSFWSFRNVAEMVRSARIRTANPAPLYNVVENPELLARPAAPGADHSISDLLTRSQADSLLISKNGKIICEWHADNIDRADPHLIFSISKSITALVARHSGRSGKSRPDDRGWRDCPRSHKQRLCRCHGATSARYAGQPRF